MITVGELAGLLNTHGLRVVRSDRRGGEFVPSGGRAVRELHAALTSELAARLKKEYGS